MFARSFKHAGNIASEVAIYRPQFEAVQQDAQKICNGSDKASWLSTIRDTFQRLQPFRWFLPQAQWNWLTEVTLLPGKMPRMFLPFIIPPPWLFQSMHSNINTQDTVQIMQFYFNNTLSYHCSAFILRYTLISVRCLRIDVKVYPVYQSKFFHSYTCSFTAYLKS